MLAAAVPWSVCRGLFQLRQSWRGRLPDLDEGAFLAMIIEAPHLGTTPRKRPAPLPIRPHRLKLDGSDAAPGLVEAKVGAMNFKVGDVVLLKSGGADMTVTGQGMGGSVICVWQNPIPKGGYSKDTAAYPPEALELKSERDERHADHP